VAIDADTANGDDRARRLRKVIGYGALLLPAQGPIAMFVHHNTLHAYEYLPFEMAVVEAASLFGCEPFLTEAAYRDELARGRIRESDLREVLSENLGGRRDEAIAGLVSRLDLRLGLLRHGVRALRGPALDWLLCETDVLRVPGDRRLWEACRRAITADEEPAQRARPAVRHRDLLLAATGTDSDTLVHRC
jgi:hypothetical protein